MERLYVDQLSPGELDSLLLLGFRHFGRHFFRPACPHCGKCIPIRIKLSSWSPSRTAVRCVRRTERFSIRIRDPRPSKEAFDLYRLHLRRFGEACAAGYGAFTDAFYHPFSFSRELAMYDGDDLICAALFDITSRSLSAVYIFYSDRYYRESLGSAAIYRQIYLALDEGLDWVYLGYLVHENRHMNYKSRYRPNQLLVDGEGWTDYILPDGGKALSIEGASFNRAGNVQSTTDKIIVEE